MFKVGDVVMATGHEWDGKKGAPRRGDLLTIIGVKATISPTSGGYYQVAYANSECDIFYLEHDFAKGRGVKMHLEARPKVGATASRQDALTKAGSLIGGDRQDTYGSPAESFGRIAKLWSALLGTEITATQVAQCLAAMKLSRLTGQNDHADSWIDLAGYAALGYEISGASSD